MCQKSINRHIDIILSNFPQQNPDQSVRMIIRDIYHELRKNNLLTLKEMARELFNIEGLAKMRKLEVLAILNERIIFD